jgi:hypothetical protein
MRGDTFVLVVKGICFAGIGGLTPVATSLAQWAGSGQWPPPINWVSIIIGGVLGAATGLLGFLSQTFGDWKTSRNGSFTGPGPTPDPATPAAPVPPKVP